jgi:hypothetical protein
LVLMRVTFFILVTGTSDVQSATTISCLRISMKQSIYYQEIVHA